MLPRGERLPSDRINIAAPALKRLREEYTPTAHNKSQARAARHGLRMTVKSLMAEGDKVALEVESYGELRNGRIYNQEYHFSITIRDGKISAVREYLDTQHVFTTWFQG